MDITPWLRGILVVALIGWLLEALQPTGEMRRYTRLAIGLLVMVAVMGPLIPWMEGMARRVPDPFQRSTDVANVVQQGVFLQQREQRMAVQQYREQVDRAAAASAEAIQGVRSASAQVTLAASLAPVAAHLTVLAEQPSAGLAASIRQSVSTALGIAAGAVRVDFGKGGG